MSWWPPPDLWAESPPRPRWGLDVPLAARVTRHGRFASIDPSVPGRVWRVGEWLGLVAWGGL
ncbi:MAG TPA: hypothetical protein VHF25_16030, partial [Nitriliruptorales bacterium]|nr:hypothetical protein [Nitriliruptorales bacterium]